MKLRRIATLFLAAAIFFAGAPAMGATFEELNDRMDTLEKQNQELREKMRQTDNKIEATAEAFESKGSRADSFMRKTEIGGYGELHYNNLSGQGGAADKESIDFHRFVLFFNYDHTERIRFNSELEVEHSIAGDDQPGEVELEQAYVDFHVNPYFTGRGGLFLLPVGILNETHEPPTFYGVERNPVEKRIIPATWWEGGAGGYGRIVPGLTYDLYVHSGLQTSADDNYAIRDGRQKVGKASAENPAATARITWRGLPGLELAASYQYQDDITQGTDKTAGNAGMLVGHGIWRKGPLALKALYARWDLDGSGPEAVGADEQAGYYIEPSYKITPKIGLFARYNQWDNQAGNKGDSEKIQWDAGINYWPHPDVVLKADYQIQDNENGRDQNGLNLGIGYQF
ncbi:MAG: OprO/OprP family phosphate-selective porin [Desulfobacteraceae bacterium]|nr:OprO/OprP family phosphate-selective porin [Desulfobacteraceae bacterium]